MQQKQQQKDAQLIPLHKKHSTAIPSNPQHINIKVWLHIR